MITLNLYLALFFAAAIGGLAGALTCYRLLKGRSPNRIILHTDADTLRRMNHHLHNKAECEPNAHYK